MWWWLLRSRAEPRPADPEPAAIDSTPSAPAVARLLELQRTLGNQAVQRLVGDAEGGRPLDERVRAAMQARFGRDLGEVRVHPEAAAASALGVQAFTRGRDMYFAPGRSAPATVDGERLLAHELAHVVQQDGGGGGGEATEPTRAAIEDEAARAEAGGPVAIRGRAGPAVVLRKDEELAAKYAAALDTLKKLDPAMHALIAKASLDGPAVAVASRTEGDTTVTWTLNVSVTSGLPASTLADFSFGLPTKSTAEKKTTLTLPMTIALDAASLKKDGKWDAATIAANLYHEGIHMLLYMDLILAGRGGPSAYAKPYADLTAVAAHAAIYPDLLAEIDVYLSMKGAKFAKPTRDVAEEMVGNLLEEKFVDEQAAAKLGGRSSNLQLAGTYVLNLMTTALKLGAPSAKPPTLAELKEVVAKVTKLFDAVDAGMKPAPTPKK